MARKDSRKKGTYTRIAIDERKIDTRVNGDAERLVVEHREVERNLRPLKINSYTTIYVPADKCNAEYAENFAKRSGLTCKVKHG